MVGLAALMVDLLVVPACMVAKAWGRRWRGGGMNGGGGGYGTVGGSSAMVARVEAFMGTKDCCR